MVGQLTIPNKLYGRDREIVTMLESFGRINSGLGEVLLVPGYSGVGKTALVQWLRQPVRDGNGFFIQGKFEQYRQNIPYFAFRQALGELCRELLAGSSQQRALYQADILQAMGDLGRLLVNLVPEFETLLGSQPPLAEISPQEARHRFTQGFQNFLQAICRPQHPLVLFLDDWQWADAASLQLLEQLQVGKAVRYLLVIIAYRDNEVDSAHPLLSTLNTLRLQAVPLEELPVKNIGPQDIRALLNDTLKPAAEDIKGLATSIHDKTRGNPFFVRSLLAFLHEFHLLWFDPAHNSWQWSLERFPEGDLPDNVVELFALKLRRLDADRRELLSLAACLGNRFDLESLSMLSQRTPQQCRTLLFSDPAQSMLVPLEGQESTCKFVHDRVQQAAYTLIEPAELPGLLLKIGRVLLANLSAEQLIEQIFEVVNHLNVGQPLIEDPVEQVKVMELNMTAARKAHAGAAYRSALQFYRAANGFLARPDFAQLLWRDHHDLTMRLFEERAECEFIEGNLAEAKACIQQAVDHARTTLEKARALNSRILQYTLLARYPEAIAAGREALAALGIQLPKEDFERARDAEIAQVRRQLAGRPVSSLLELPVMTHPEMLMASRILITMGPPCYRSHQRLWGVIVPKVVNLTLSYGNIPQVGYSHPAFGGLLGWVDNDYATAREFAELATHLMTGTFRSPSDQSVFYLMIGSSIRHWFKHLKGCTQDYTDAVEIGLRSGNLQYAAYAFGHNMVCRFYQGVPLHSLLDESQHWLEFSRTRLNQWAIDLLEGGNHLFGVLSARHAGSNGHLLRTEQEYLGRVEDHHNIQVTCIYKVIKTLTLLVLGHQQSALLLSDEVEPLIYTVGTQGLLAWPEHVFARVLILTALYSQADEERQACWRAELTPMMSRLRIWADNCPENFQHKYWLATAELARIDGQPVEAIRFYDKAVEAAQSGGFHQWQAMANERAYSFWQECGNDRLAQVYWQQAYAAYHRWGATAKVNSMEAAYRAYLEDNMPTRDREMNQFLLEKQIEQLHSYASLMQQAKLRIEAETKAEEMARAAQRLREAVVEPRRELREIKDLHRSILHMALDGFWLIDTHGHLLEVNESYCQMSGYSAQELLTMNISDLKAADDAGQTAEHIHNIRTRGWERFESRHRRKDGSDFDVEVSAQYLPQDSGRIMGFLRDISERKRAEEERAQIESQLHQAQKMESVGRLAGGVAHDFNNMLGVILGHVELAMAELDPSQPLYADLEEIQQAAERSADLTRQLLAFARKQTIAPRVLDLNENVGGMLKMLQRLLGEDIRLHWKPDAKIGPVNVDPSQIDQLLANLCVNARDAIAGVGTMTIETRATVFDKADSAAHPGFVAGEYVWLAVSDSGCGMDREMLAHIFEPFFTTKGVGKGTGLGLSIVYGIVQQNNGFIDVRSEPGQGTTFTIYLPRHTAATGPALIDGAAVEVIRGHETVLLVEDEPALLRITTKMLQNQGYTLIAASTPGEAIRLARQHAGPIHLLLTDVVMPEMNGLELAQNLVSLYPNLKRMFMSGYSADVIAPHGVLNEGVCFLQKPFTRESLATKVREALGA